MALPRLLLVLDRSRWLDEGKLIDRTLRACEAGLGWIQLRDRERSVAEIERLALRLDRVLPVAVLRSINDRPELADRLGWGLHLPAAAPRPELSRRPWPLGRSVHGANEVDSARLDEPDYLIVGTLFPTDSKPGVPGIGIDGLRTLQDRAAGVPTLGIGGVDGSRAKEIRNANAWGAAVCGAVLGEDDPRDAVSALLDALYGDSR